MIHVWKNGNPESQGTVGVDEVIWNLEQIMDRWESIGDVSQRRLRVERIILCKKWCEDFLLKFVRFKHNIV
jgi:hypothetical protein